METQNDINFQRIEEAIEYIRDNFRRQPSLDEVAEYIHLSPYHFQRMFTDWAGVSPKKFLQYISTSYAKKLLKEDQVTLSEASHETGLSGTSRLHDLFVNMEGMSPGEYKNGGKNLSIQYSFAESPFGKVIVAATEKGVCHLAFVSDEEQAFHELIKQFPNAVFNQHFNAIQRKALSIFAPDWNELDPIKLHLKGTDFQLKVWEALIKIPPGRLSSYGRLAAHIGKPKASRAVGSAIGGNPIAYLIPCHRVIQSTGHIGGYHWGTNRKTAMIGWEALQSNPTK